MKKRLFPLFLMAIAFALSAQPSMDEFFPVDRGHSYVGFTIEYMGYAKVRGRFENFNGSVRYVEGQPSKTSVSFTVETASIDTDHNWRDNDLKSANWLDVEKYPVMTFISRKSEETGSGFKVTGDLTIKDVTKPVTFHMDKPSGVLKDGRGDAQVIFTGTTEIDRTDFHVEGERWSKIKEGITAVSKTVQIEVSILGKQLQESNLTGFVSNPERPPGKLYAAYSEGGVEATLQAFDELRNDEEAKLNSNAIGLVGYLLLRKGKINDAIRLFEANVQAFPADGNAFDSLAEAYARAGEIEKSKSHYKKSLQLDPGNIHAQEVLRHL